MRQRDIGIVALISALMFAACVLDGCSPTKSAQAPAPLGPVDRVLAEGYAGHPFNSDLDATAFLWQSGIRHSGGHVYRHFPALDTHPQ